MAMIQMRHWYDTNGTGTTAVGMQMLQEEANRMMREHMMDMIRTEVNPPICMNPKPVSQNKTLLLL